MSRSNGILSPVQTNFNENSIPTAKLNSNQKRSLFCILLKNDLFLTELDFAFTDI